MADTTIESKNAKVRVFTPTNVSLYVGAVAAIYQYTFWKPFNLNILQFVSLADMVKLSVWPAIGFGITFLLGAFFGHMGGMGEPVASVPEGLRGIRKFRAFVNAFPSFVLILLMFLGNTVLFFLYDSPLRWFTLGACGGVVTAFFVTRRIVSSQFNPKLPRGTVALLSMLPWIAWGIAAMRADEIRGGYTYERVEASAKFRQSAAIPESAELRYLAYVGDNTLMLVDGGPRVVIARNEDLRTVTLTPIQNPSIRR